MEELLKRLTISASKYANQDGQIPTSIPFFEILKSESRTPLRHGLLKPSFCVILQGKKKVFVGDEVLNYGPGMYLAAIVDFPVSGQVVGASPVNPYIGLRIEYTTEEINTVLREADLKLNSKAKVHPGAFTAKASENVLKTFQKLLDLLERQDDISYLSKLLKKELIYHLLTSDAGHLFAQNVFVGPKDEGLGHAINWIRENFDQSFSMDELAKACSMSVSSLHHKFKAFASMGPLQYQKQLRLQEARRLLMNGEESDATHVAFRVGYESSSQFSREYRRLFGLPPIQDAKELRKFSAKDI